MERYGFPVPAPRDAAYQWAHELGPRLPGRGRAYLYTGALYQLVPYIEASLAARERLSRLPGAARAARLAARLGVAEKALRPRRELLEWSRRVVSSAARLAATAHGGGLAYLYEDDLYSGVLLHDLGLEEAFADHARRVYGALRARGAERIVTIDPHTTHVMRDVYPRYVDGYSLEVVNYLELLDPGSLEPGGGGEAVAVHDPCLYARSLGIVEQPRRLLEAAGYEVREPRRAGRDTYCCGGPVEAVAPRLGLAIAEERLRELLDTGAEKVVTLCPVCFLSLTRASQALGLAAEIRDIAELLAGGPGGGAGGAG